MRVLAVATTYPIDKLGEADAALPDLHGISPDDVIRAIAQIGQGSRFPATQPE
jgi:hypothetical protein